MAATLLTEDFVRDVDACDRPDRLIADGSGLNLYLRVLASGRKSWLLRVRQGGRWHVQTLGEWRGRDNSPGHRRPHLSAAQARQRAAAA